MIWRYIKPDRDPMSRVDDQWIIERVADDRWFHKTACLFRYNSIIKSILFICYNMMLINYIRRLLAEKGVPFGRDGVQVKHFYELCSEILGEPVEYENQDSDYYEMVSQEALDKAETSDLRFDAVLVDDGQNIYHRRFSWKKSRD